MSVVDKLKNVIGNGSTQKKTRFVCQECGSEFESFKTRDRVVCHDCTSNDVESAESQAQSV